MVAIQGDEMKTIIAWAIVNDHGVIPAIDGHLLIFKKKKEARYVEDRDVVDRLVKVRIEQASLSV